MNADDMALIVALVAVTWIAAYGAERLARRIFLYRAADEQKPIEVFGRTVRVMDVRALADLDASIRHSGEETRHWHERYQRAREGNEALGDLIKASKRETRDALDIAHELEQRCRVLEQMVAPEVVTSVLGKREQRTVAGEAFGG